jgi:hypothetical protein
MKIGDKAKVVDKESFLYNKTVELTKIDNEVYIFYCEPKKLNFVVHKDLIQKTIEWESSPDKTETNFDKLLGQNGELVEERKISMIRRLFTERLEFKLEMPVISWIVILGCLVVNIIYRLLVILKAVIAND